MIIIIINNIIFIIDIMCIINICFMMVVMMVE